jgi:hypothetical protein
MVLVALAALAVLALLPATAAADGLPAVGIDARPLSAPAGELEYTTERAGAGTRLIERARYGGPLRTRRLAGSFSIPAVAYDGSPSGVSADGSTLVLISPRTRYPRKRTTFAVVDARRLAIRRRVSLRGDFSLDALSPDGRTIYLIEYSPRNVADYAVRAYDLGAGRLYPRPVVDPSEPEESMTGAPVTRATSPDGRWAYTLHSSQPHPFVHALDTERRTAVCIDLDDVHSLSALELHGNRLDVLGGRGGVVASIDTSTHRVIPRPAKRTPATEESAAGIPWLLIAAPTAALLLLAAVGRRRAARRRVRAIRSGV